MLAAMHGHEQLGIDEGQTDQLERLGAALRRRFLSEVLNAAAKGRQVGDLDIVTALHDSATTGGGIRSYIRRMTVPDGRAPSKEQWGGFAEARAMAEAWMIGARFYIVEWFPDGTIQLFTEPFGSDRAKCCCLALSGESHFDVVLGDSPLWGLLEP